MMEIIRRADWRRSRWRNGAGWGYEIVAEPRTATDPGKPFEWRLAVAEIERDAPFSHYAGVERAIMLLEGEGFDLDIDGHAGVRARERHMPHWFPGDRATRCRLVASPCRVLNLMTERSRWRAAVRIGTTLPAEGGHTCVALVLEGQASLNVKGRAMPLGLHDLILWQAEAPELRLAPGATLYTARLDSLTP